MKLKGLLLIAIMFATSQQLLAAQQSKVLIAYFSWSGNTKEVAKQIQELTGGDVYEIKTVTPYSSNYNECVEAAKKEKENNARPAIQGKVENFEEYDIVYIGFPNWWGTMPMAVWTFLDSYDFTGKTLLPFCTHGGGGKQQCFIDFSKQTKAYNSRKGFIVNGDNVKKAKPHVDKWINEQSKSIK